MLFGRPLDELLYSIHTTALLERERKTLKETVCDAQDTEIYRYFWLHPDEGQVACIVVQVN